MSKTLTPTRFAQLRRVAILVASLDARSARQMLDTLPAVDADDVRMAVELLDDVSPDEQTQIVAEFRRGIANCPAPRTEPTDAVPANEGVELDPALLAKLDAMEEAAAGEQQSAPLDSILEADSDSIARLLEAEHPQVVAVILSRIEQRRAAELLGCFSPQMQADLISRVAELDATDPQSLEVVEAQLAQWISEQRRCKERQAAGVQLVEQLLGNTPTAQRNSLLSRLGQSNPVLAGRLSRRQFGPLSNRSAAQRITPVASKPAQPVPSSAARQTPSRKRIDPVAAMEELDESQLAAALRQLDERTSLLALAGASEKTLDRVVGSLPRREAKRFRRHLQTIGPMRLADIDHAQRMLLQAAALLNQPNYS